MNSCRDRGYCKACHTYYITGCLAGNGDDLFIPIPSSINIKELEEIKRTRDEKNKKRSKKRKSIVTFNIKQMRINMTTTKEDMIKQLFKKQ